MDMYENIINALGRMAEHDLNAAMILEACLEFTCSELCNEAADTYFKERFGERLHYLIENVIEHM